jgi:hypothetical protein
MTEPAAASLVLLVPDAAVPRVLHRQHPLDAPPRLVEDVGRRVTRLSSLGAPTADIDEMLAEIEAGRR